jgi:ribosomal protein S18 acetylase RimI-like enzyme
MFAEYVPRPGTRAPAFELSVRIAAPDDVPELARLSHQRQGGLLSTQLESFERALALPLSKNVVLIAEAEGALLGCGKCNRFEPPEDAPPNGAPAGWYLGGVVVAPRARRRGIGRRLTQERLRWLAERTGEAFYIVTALNRPSIDLHTPFGFVEVTRDFHMPGVSFTGGVGILSRVDLTERQGETTSV